ncbi:hypothetical protein EPR50_G00116160 [Perca flavescens]|uniref:Uncharacterized protein n=1 Tax=Perca flavescens TaxID=8167 RepID=A0A484CT01_PERFV|nr:hypothetical protein EPR50_G00116160 [Perca flavescens]
MQVGVLSPAPRIIHTSIYVVRRIQASIAAGEQLEKPIITPCSAVAKKRAGHESIGNAPAAALRPNPDEGVSGAAGPGTSSETAVQKCGS